MEYKRLTKKGLENGEIHFVLDKNNKVIVDRKLFEEAIKIHKRLAVLEDKIENGTLIELPFIWKSKKNSNEYIVVYEDEQTGHLVGYCCVGDDAKERAEKWLKELQNG